MKKENKLFFVPLVGKTSACRQKEGLKQIKKLPLLPRLTAVLPPQGREMRRGFTLIELLVVVLIIGILSAIAVPQYQKAVLKSRFSSLMPTTQAIRDGNEIYYMTNGRYADAVSKLDVTATNNADMTLTVSDDMDYAYTMSTRPSLKNNLIMYQKHSLNFPGEIHCEALQGNKLANWVCETGMHGEKISGGITGGYNTYIIEGSNKGLFGAVALVSSCDKAEAMGLTCNLTTDDEGNVTQKKVCNEEGICSVIDYNENGYKRTTCQLDASDVCETKMEYTYDANGNKLTQRECSSVDSNGNCTAYSSGNDYTYDANGNQLTQRYCSSFDNNGNCTGYSTWGRNYDYTYDANGNKLTERNCSGVDSNGNCTSYYPWDNYDYTYDANGNMLTRRRCDRVDSSGNCTAYSGGNDYTYDANGNKTYERSCARVEADGSCSAYRGDSDYYYMYDENGNRISSRSCGRFEDGICTMYSNGGTSGSSYDYTYDSNGNKLSERVCQTVAADGSCSAYSQVGSHYISYTYDDDGNKTSEKQCKTFNGTECVEWDTPTYY